MHSAPEIVVAGELFVDLILSGFPEWPQPGKEVFATDFRREIGGGTAITACGLARLGQHVGVLGIIGNEWGEWMKTALADRRVNTDWIEFDPCEPTAFTVIATRPEDRAFLTYSGANRGFEALLMKALDRNQFAGVRHVHLAYPPSLETAARLFEQLYASGCTISLDFGWRQDWITNRSALELLRHLDLFFPNEIEARHLTGENEPKEMLRVLQSAGLKCVALKLGARGAALLWDGKTEFAEPHPVVPVDTTGAGDCFDAGFLYGWLGGQTPRQCLQMANICGALSTTQYGGIAGFPTLARLEDELRKATPCAK